MAVFDHQSIWRMINAGPGTRYPFPVLTAISNQNGSRAADESNGSKSVGSSTMCSPSHHRVLPEALSDSALNQIN